MKWHAKLGHIGEDRRTTLVEEGLLDQLNKVKLPKCKPCLARKATKKLIGKISRCEVL